MAKVQFCSKCGRPRKGHPLPTGSKCKLTPLTQKEKEDLLETLKQESGDTEVEIELVEDDDASENPKSKEGEKESVADRVRKLREQKEQLIEQNNKVAESLKSAEEKDQLLELRMLEEEVQKLYGSLEDGQAKLVVAQSSIEDRQKQLASPSPAAPKAPTPATVIQPPMPVHPQFQAQSPGMWYPGYLPHGAYGAYPAFPGANVPLPGPPGQVPGAAPANQASAQHVFKTPAVPPLPGTASTPTTPANAAVSPAHLFPAQQALDPSMQVYARAITGQYGPQVQPSSNSPHISPAAPGAQGVDMAKLLADNPGLAAACGYNGNNLPASHSQGKSDKSDNIAENFMYKFEVREKDRPTYYDFMHGALRMMKIRLTQDHLPIDDYLKYYEYLASMTTQYKWHSVYDMHVAHCYEIEVKRKTWADPIDPELKDRCLNAGSSLHRGEPRSGARPRDRDGDSKGTGGSSSRDSSRSSSSHRGGRSGHTKGYTPTCDLFNEDPDNCTFPNCKFRHECSECEHRGKKAAHSASYCEYTRGHRAAGATSQSGGGRQAGGAR